METILDILENDARTAPEVIGQMMNKSADEVRQLIKKYEDEKIILGYKAIIDNDRANRNFVRAIIEVKVTPEREGGFDRIAERIAKFDEVQSCYLMSGAYDLLVMLEGEDLKHVARFVSEKLSPIDGVISTSTHFMLKPYKERGTIFIQEEGGERLKVSP
ncbi:MAG: Lrp/AsnC family transcriptional regulator [Verrucomicrobiota bacterium]